MAEIYVVKFQDTSTYPKLYAKKEKPVFTGIELENIDSGNKRPYNVVVLGDSDLEKFIKNLAKSIHNLNYKCEVVSLHYKVPENLPNSYFEPCESRGIAQRDVLPISEGEEKQIRNQLSPSLTQILKTKPL